MVRLVELTLTFGTVGLLMYAVVPLGSIVINALPALIGALTARISRGTAADSAIETCETSPGLSHQSRG
jgi:hypothetical protein